MPRADLLVLAERVEDLEGPCRETDAEIMFDLFAKPAGCHKEDGGPIGYLWPEDNPSWNFGLRFPGKDQEWFVSCRAKIQGETLLIKRDGAFVLMNSLRIPALTASIDAVVDLIERELPDDWTWTLGQNLYHRHHVARVNRLDEGTPTSVALTSHRNSASLALLAAFLRARASMGAKHG